MYQFPDSSEVMGQQEEPDPLKKKTRYKIIIIANLLLAFFILAIVWFFFFFEKKSSNMVATVQPLITKSIYHSTGDFTPIINIENDTETLSAETSTLSTIVEKTNKTTAIQENQSKSLSAIDLIANELMKNSKLKNKQTNKTTDATSALTTQSEQKKSPKNKREQELLKKNQVIISSSIQQPLEKKLAEIQQKITHSSPKITQLRQQILDQSKRKTQHKSRNTAIYNSIPLKSQSDIDKIMLAMGSIKKTAKVKTVDKIDATIRKLLKNETGKLQQTDLYLRNLQPESEENRKEVRTITVRKGEKLWDIAVRAYGDGNKYKILLQANPVLKDNPKLIKAGITLFAPLKENK